MPTIIKSSSTKLLEPPRDGLIITSRPTKIKYKGIKIPDVSTIDLSGLKVAFVKGGVTRIIESGNYEVHNENESSLKISYTDISTGKVYEISLHFELVKPYNVEVITNPKRMVFYSYELAVRPPVVQGDLEGMKLKLLYEDGSSVDNYQDYMYTKLDAEGYHLKIIYETTAIIDDFIIPIEVKSVVTSFANGKWADIVHMISVMKQYNGDITEYIKVGDTRNCKVNINGTIVNNKMVILHINPTTAMCKFNGDIYSETPTLVIGFKEPTNYWDNNIELLGMDALCSRYELFCADKNNLLNDTHKRIIDDIDDIYSIKNNFIKINKTLSYHVNEIINVSSGTGELVAFPRINSATSLITLPAINKIRGVSTSYVFDYNNDRINRVKSVGAYYLFGVARMVADSVFHSFCSADGNIIEVEWFNNVVETNARERSYTLKKLSNPRYNPTENFTSLSFNEYFCI